MTFDLDPEADASLCVQGVRTATLQLSAMQEGDYTFKLKVSDSSGQQDVALVTVIVQPGNQDNQYTEHNRTWVYTEWNPYRAEPGSA